MTPGSGFMNCQMAFLIGTLGGIASYATSAFLKNTWNLDDALDVTALQAAPGLVGSIFVGFAAQTKFFPDSAGPNGVFFGGGYDLLGAQVGMILPTWYLGTRTWS